MSPEAGPFIRLEKLRKEFDGLIAVAGLDLEVAEGEFMCFLGSSGCGKTTTLRMIAGLETPTSGEVFLRGTRITHLSPQDRNVGFVFQNYALFWHMTVRDNLAFGLRVRNAPAQEIDKRVRDVATSLELMDVLEVKASRLDLSAMQRVAMARTLVPGPDVLLLDEPLNNFRPGLREVMRGELKRWQVQLGWTMIYVTHDQEEAMTLGDRILVMDAGRCEQLGGPRDVYSYPANLFVAGFIGRPPMNLFDVAYSIEYDRAFVRHGDLRWEVSHRRGSIEASMTTPALVLGIRPEHIALDDGSGTPAIPAQVDLVQPLARKTVVDLRIGDSLVKMLVPSTSAFTRGETVRIMFDPQHIHLFDKASGKAVV